MEGGDRRICRGARGMQKICLKISDRERQKKGKTEGKKEGKKWVKIRANLSMKKMGQEMSFSNPLAIF